MSQPPTETPRARAEGANPFALGDDKRWHYRRSLASRVAVLTSLAVAAALLMMMAATFLTVRMQLQNSLDDQLLNRATKAASSTTLAEMTNAKFPGWMLGAADVRIVFITAAREVFTADEQRPKIVLGNPELEVAAGSAETSVRTIVAEDGSRYRVAAVQAGPGNALILAQPLAAQDRTLTKLSLVMLAFGGFGVITAALSGWAVATNGLRPVRRLTDATEHIAQTQELNPLPIEGDDEVARLATAFNHMLAELSASQVRQRRLVADAGHELRTPLTSLRTNIDLLAQAGDSLPAETRAEMLDDVRAQSMELTTLVGDLVELARDEPVAHTVEEIDLTDVVERALSRVRRRAASVHFEVDLAPWTVMGEAGSLERAITNLLDNAAKWSPVDGTVRVQLRDGVLTVCDEGPGIAPEDLPHVFERFYRSKESRTMPGSGLGLSIVKQVAERHGGAARADNVPGSGARLALWLPGANGG